MHLFHVFSTFLPAGPQNRTVAIMNALAGEARHTIMPMDGRAGAAASIDPEVQFRIVMPPPRRALYPLALRRILRQARPDLLITYNWGAIESVAAALGLCPVVHTEDGFGPDEALRLKRRRVWARRLLLRTAYCTVVPSRTLLRIAQTEYRLPPAKVRFIPNGVDTERFRPGRNGEMRARLGVDASTVLFGFLGGLRGEKNLALLLRAFAAARLDDARLALCGEGPDRPALEALARELGIADRVIFAGQAGDPQPYLAALDVFVLSSLTEQMPLALLEAMASGLPALCTDVGDIREVLGDPPPLAVVPPSDVAAYAAALRAFAAAPALRASLAQANRARCIREYSLDRVIREYRAVYRAAVG